MFDTEGMVENGVLSIEIPRTDIHATVFGVPANPDAILEHEFTFQHTDNGAIVKYEFVVLDEEANPVLDALFAHQDQLPPGITILNALHNHWLEIKPDVKYMHGTARNDALTMAKALRAALERTATPLGMSSGSGDTGLPNEQIAQIIGGTPMVDDHVLKVDVERKETIEELDVVLKPEMQVEHETIFQPIGNGRAAMYTEYILLPEEVHAVARELREHNQFVVSRAMATSRKPIHVSAVPSLRVGVAVAGRYAAGGCSAPRTAHHYPVHGYCLNHHKVRRQTPRQHVVPDLAAQRALAMEDVGPPAPSAHEPS